MFDGDIVGEVIGEVVSDVDDGVIGKSDRAANGCMVSRAGMLVGWKEKTLVWSSPSSATVSGVKLVIDLVRAARCSSLVLSGN